MRWVNIPGIQSWPECVVDSDLCEVYPREAPPSADRPERVSGAHPFWPLSRARHPCLMWPAWGSLGHDSVHIEDGY